MVHTRELSRLPLRGIVAFAARCARRVESLAAELGEESGRIVHCAIAIAETFARRDDLDKTSLDETVRVVARTADVVLYASAVAATVGGATIHAARAAWAAAETTRAACTAVWSGNYPGEAPLSVALAIHAAQLA